MASKLLKSRFLRSRLLLGFLIVAELSTLDMLAQSPGTFTPTGNTVEPRFGHTATLLNDGRVLIAGGFLPYAEIYDPATGTFAPTGSMNHPRGWHSATLLADGRVLVVGGYDSDWLATAELYDPVTGTFTETGSLHTARYHPDGILLSTGMVLISGSPDFELYDPATGTFTPIGGANASEWGADARAARLYDGRVLSVGGYTCVPGANNVGVCSSQNASLFDPNPGMFSFFAFPFVALPPGPSAPSDLLYHSVTLLPNGKVLVAGGCADPYFGSGDVAQAVIYDPGTGTFQPTGSLLQARSLHTATLLANGSVLITGGYDEPLVGNVALGILASAESYDPNTGTFTSAGMMVHSREEHTATLLRDGRVLIVGGWTNDGVDSTAELYVPAADATSQCGKYPTVNGLCRRIGILPWYAGISGQWETDLQLSAGSDAVQFGYLTSLSLTYDGIGHNLQLEDYRGSVTAESVDHLNLKSGDSYSAAIVAGQDCQSSQCQTAASFGSLVVTIDGLSATALDGAQIRETLKLLGTNGSVAGATDVPVVFRDQASNRWSADLMETPLSQQAQSGATVTAFAVANLSLAPQAVIVKVFDTSGMLVASTKTPILNGAFSLGTPFDSAALVGGVYAGGLSTLLGIDLALSPGSTLFHGTVTFEGEMGGQIAPMVIRGSWPPIASVPVIPE